MTSPYSSQTMAAWQCEKRPLVFCEFQHGECWCNYIAQGLYVPGSYTGMAPQRRFTRGAWTPWARGCLLWLSEAIPNDWSKAVLLSLFNEGDKRICCYYRGNSLVGVAVKVFALSFSKGSSQREASAPTLSKVAIGSTNQMNNLHRTLE